MLYVLKSGRLAESLVAEVSSKSYSKVLDENRGYLLVDSEKQLDFATFGACPIAFEVLNKSRNFDVKNLAQTISDLNDETNRFFLDSNFLTPKQLRMVCIDLKKMLVKEIRIKGLVF